MKPNKMSLQEYIKILTKPIYIATREQLINYLNRAYKQGKTDNCDEVIAYLKRKELNYGKSNFSRSAIRYITKLKRGL